MQEEHFKTQPEDSVDLVHGSLYDLFLEAQKFVALYKLTSPSFFNDDVSSKEDLNYFVRKMERVIKKGRKFALDLEQKKEARQPLSDGIFDGDGVPL